MKQHRAEHVLSKRLSLLFLSKTRPCSGLSAAKHGSARARSNIAQTTVLDHSQRNGREKSF